MSASDDADLKTYRELLQSHDWTFEYSDDTRVYWKGRHEQQQLIDIQRRLDPTCAIWNSLAPENYRREGKQ